MSTVERVCAAVCALTLGAAPGCAVRPPAVSTAANAPGSGTAAKAPARTGVLIPLYVPPNRQWDVVIAAKSAHSSVPMVLVVDVADGPGGRRDPHFGRYVERAQKAGVVVLGYVDTRRGKIPASQIDNEMQNWYDFYATDGAFLDHMAPDNAAYYRAATQYAHAHELWFVMGNPGTNASGDDGPDVINYYQRRGYPTVAYMREPAHRQFGKLQWSYVAGAVPFDRTRVAVSAHYVGYLYATDGREPECYCTLPTYFDQLVATLDSLR
ncbi:MAG TPA: spherulation-specific family 4 protein [Candidatus Acidoferrales bacterium]|nr:spherulation-specific family 4 protein [Candidatus Acidoferrales bacterium]